MSDQTADRNQRLATAGLSAVGATAGAAGLGYAGHKLGQAYRAAPKALGVKGRLVRAASKEKFGTALLPLEAAGLGGELMATKILHGDTKKQPVVKATRGQLIAMRRLSSSRDPQVAGRARGLYQRHLERTGRARPEPGLSEERIQATRANEKYTRSIERERGGYVTQRPKLRNMAPMSMSVSREPYRVPGKSGSPHKQTLSQSIETMRTNPFGKSRETSMEFNGSSRTGRRIVEPSQTTANREAREAISPEDFIAKADRKRKKASAGRLATGGVFPGIHGLVAGKEGPGDHKIKAAGYELGGAVLGGALVPGVGTIPGGAVGTHLAHEAGHYKHQKVRKSGAGVLRSMQALQRSSTKGKLALKEGLASQRKAQGAKTHGDFVALQQKVGKARRYDSEADRQRRIGYVGGAATGGALIAGEVARRNTHLSGYRGEGFIQPNAGKRAPGSKRVKLTSTNLRIGRKGALAAAAATGLTGLAVGTFKHGVSERNKTWT